MSNLDAVLCHALELRAEMDETPLKELDLGYGGLVEGWNVRRCSTIYPKRISQSEGRLKQSEMLKQSEICLDLVGIGLDTGNKGCLLFWRKYPTGLADAARLLRTAFLQGVFGPDEHVATNTLESLSGNLKLVPKRTRPEEIFALALEDIGFAPLGNRYCLRGVDRVKFRDHQICLKLLKKKPLRLARSRKFSGPRSVSADALLQQHVPGFKKYLSRAQRDTVRELCDPNGKSVVIARLPTGGGKSLCYFLAAAHARTQKRPHTAVVVSPIVALQNDQVLQVKHKLNAELHAKLKVGQINMTVPLEERKKIYGKLFHGELDVLFLSPEKLIEPFFRETLLALAKRKQIGFLVIDEAHIVPKWGRDFRTHYYRLGVIREELRDRCRGLRTLILSATLTDANEKHVLEVLRIEEKECARITDTHIRQEISIRVERLKTKGERIERLIEIAPFLPAPTIVYCNRKDNVRHILKRMKREGIFRCFDYTGSTSAASRPERLQAFHRGDVSFVVATNAFGLGIDKQDVRSVVHFDVPANLDACYQEIGRAARDRRTGHAFIFYSPSGMGQVTRRGHPITSENAWQRYQAMFDGRFPKKQGCPVLLPIHALPAYMCKDGKYDSPLNRQWNLATLNILERQDLVDVRGVVYRHLRISRSEQKPARTVDDLASTMHLIKQLMGRRKSVEVDLAEGLREPAGTGRTPFRDDHSGPVGCHQAGTIG